MASTRSKTLLLALVATLLALFAATAAPGAMRSERLPGGICETTGGAKIVDLPSFPGERIDRRLLADVKMLERKYKILVTDGYSNDPAHSANGEHPMGLALDIVPNAAKGGTWRDVTRLAKWAEPTQDQPIAPFRWVGYDGDSGHGRGHHLHLSWNHSETRPGTSPATVYTKKCPTKNATGVAGGGKAGAEEPTGTKPDGGGKASSGEPTSSGGVSAGSGGTSGSSGGVGAGRVAVPGDVVVETDGIDAP